MYVIIFNFLFAVKNALYEVQGYILIFFYYYLLLLLFGSITTAAVLGIIYSVFNTYQPLPEGFFKYGNYNLRTFQVMIDIIKTSMKILII